jgi:hypothetical protein
LGIDVDAFGDVIIHGILQLLVWKGRDV